MDDLSPGAYTVPPPITRAPPQNAPSLHGFNPQRIMASPVPNAVEALPDLSGVTDIEIPDLNTVVVRDFTKFDSKLTVSNPDPNLEYRWVNSDMQRYSRLFSEGYRPVNNKERAKSEVAGSSGPELFAGTDSEGAARRAILMARPKVLRQRRDATYRQLIKENQESLDPAKYQGNNGTTDNNSFTGAVNIGGSIKA